MFLIFEGYDYEGHSIIGCRLDEKAAVERARELATGEAMLRCDWISVVEYPDGCFDLPRFATDARCRQVICLRPRDYYFEDAVEEAEQALCDEFDALPILCGPSRVSRKATGKTYLPAGGPTRASIRRRVNRAAKRGARHVLR